MPTPPKTRGRQQGDGHTLAGLLDAAGPDQPALKALTASLILGQETEKRNLARELHDVFSQKVAVVGMELSALGRKPPRSPVTLGKRLQALSDQIVALAEDIHRMSRRLHPAILDDLGLAPALKNECDAFSRQRGLPVEFTAAGAPSDLPRDVSLCLYRVAQESLRNVARHAGPARVRVALSGDQREVALSVEDTGNGFRPGANHRGGGLGLVSMEERVRLVNGSLSVKSQPGRGARVEVRVPLERRRSA